MRSLSLWAVVLVLACGGGDDKAPPEPTKPAPTKPAPPPTPPPMPQKPEPTSEPTGDLRGDAKKGAQVYSTYCATCHGSGGKGDGPVGASLDPKPADHSDAEYMGGLSDAHIYKVIQKGGAAIGKSPLMAPWGGVLSDSDIRDVLAFVRQLSGT